MAREHYDIALGSFKRRFTKAEWIGIQKALAVAKTAQGNGTSDPMQDELVYFAEMLNSSRMLTMNGVALPS